MTCDLCGKNEATVHLTEIIDDESRELHLCEPCAREKGTGMAQPFGLADLLAGLSDFTALQEAEGKPRPKCPQCGMTYEDFRKLGKLGCGECYETFHRFLGSLLKRIHGSTQHVGKAPPQSPPQNLADSPSTVASVGGQAPPAPSVPASKKAAPARRTPAPSEKLADLKAKLKQAIEAENFEEAAALRDKIRVLEKRSKG